MRMLSLGKVFRQFSILEFRFARMRISHLCIGLREKIARGTINFLLVCMAR